MVAVTLYLSEMEEAFYRFERYMTSERWDRLGIRRDDGIDAVQAYIEFCNTGEVSDEREDE